jgi:hypothetical protein
MGVNDGGRARGGALSEGLPEGGGMTGAGLLAAGAGAGFAKAGAGAAAGGALAAGAGVAGVGGATGVGAFAAGRDASATGAALAGDTGAAAADAGAGVGGVTTAGAGAGAEVPGAFAAGGTDVGGVTGPLADPGSVAGRGAVGAAGSGGVLALASSAGLASEDLVGRKIRGRQNALDGTSGGALAALVPLAGTAGAVPDALWAGASFFSRDGATAAVAGLLGAPPAVGAMAIRPPTGSVDAAFAGAGFLRSVGSAVTGLAAIRSAPGAGLPAAASGLAVAGALAPIFPAGADTGGLLVEAGSIFAPTSGAGAPLPPAPAVVPVLVFDSAAAVITAAKAGKTTGLTADSFSGGLPLTRLPAPGPAVRGTSLPKPAWPAFPAVAAAAAGNATSGSG